VGTGEGRVGDAQGRMDAVAKRFVRIGLETEIPEGEVRVFEAEGIGIAIARVEGKLYAIEDVCTHDDGPLGEGVLEGCEIECPRHGARFDVRTGAVTRMPAAAAVAVVALKVEKGEIFAEVEAE
jgi:3-phenylpropionate/trans-cinnamate dioxygenase ferredoxin component